MFKRALGQDARSKRLRETIQEDDNLDAKQKRRLLNSLLSTAVLSVDELNELEIHDDQSEVSAEETVETSSEEEAEDEDAEIFKDKTNKSFRLCKHCPGRRMLTDDDVRKHLESKIHQKRKLKQVSSPVA